MVLNKCGNFISQSLHAFNGIAGILARLAIETNYGHKGFGDRGSIEDVAEPYMVIYTFTSFHIHIRQV